MHDDSPFGSVLLFVDRWRTDLKNTVPARSAQIKGRFNIAVTFLRWEQQYSETFSLLTPMEDNKKVP
jgi:hypothetical protein